MAESTFQWSDDTLSEIFRWLPLRTRGRVELASKKCKGLAYTGFRSQPPDSGPFKNVWPWLEFASRKPTLANSLWKLHIKPPGQAELRLVLPALFASALSVTKVKIEVRFSLASETWTLLARSKLTNLRNLRFHVKNYVKDAQPDKEFYQSMRGEDFQSFPRLHVLSITCERPFLATPEVLTGIARHLGATLQVLHVTTDDWSPLKSMQKLTELFVTTTGARRELVDWANLDRAVALQREANPPGVGLHLHLNSYPQLSYNFLALWDPIVDSSNPLATSVLRQLVAQGLDLRRNFSRGFTASTKTCILVLVSAYRHHAWVEKQMEVMLELQPDALWRQGKRRRHSIFEDAFTDRFAQGPWWTQFATWLFDNPWKVALQRNSKAELLGHTAQVPLAIKALKSRLFPLQRLRFVMDRSDIFGPVVGVADAKGRNLMHHCKLTREFNELSHLGIDWRARDSRGRTALDRWAYRGAGTLVASVLLGLSDHDFLIYATKFVVGGLPNDPIDNRPSVLNRLLDLEAGQAKELAIHFFQTQLRRERADFMEDLISVPEPSGDPRLKEFALLSLIEPYDGSYWEKYPNLSTRPVPHLLLRHFESANWKPCTDQLRALLGPIKFAEWASARDEKGRDWAEYTAKPSPRRGSSMALAAFGTQPIQSPQ